jgi:pilus assembly protein FimV
MQHSGRASGSYMSWKLRVLIAAMLAAPQAGFALGLGDIRLNSALNEPLSAEIDLVAAAPGESDAVRARLASRELFERYGLERAQYLDSVTFKVGKGRGGRTALLVRSSAPIAEPFVTFLVEVDWPRGKLLREYTVLLDPPVYTPAETARPAAVASPRVQSAPPQRMVEPSPAPAVEQPAPVVESRPSPAERPSTYRVRRNDTLFGIAAGFAGGERRSTQRMMIGLFRANPGAFGGNINRLQQGATLRVPSADEIAAIGADEAAAEISRQTVEWRETLAAPQSEPSRLKLVTPEEGAAPAVAATGTGSTADATRLRQLEQQLAETRRLLEVKSSELAALQSKLAAREPAVAAPASSEEPVAGSVGAAGTAAVAEPGEEARPAKPSKAAKEKVVEGGPSLLDRITGGWLYLVGAAGLLLAGAFGFGYLRRRREDEFDDAFTAPVPAPTHSDTQIVRAIGVPLPDDIVVEERSGPPAAHEPAVRHDDTFSRESAVNIDHSDPLAEADFHMAYGLHDQAADLIKLALDKEPQRRDLKNKLLEVYFVWGNKDRFIDLARELQSTRDSAPAGEWERVVIMGRQIAPEHALFAGTLSSAALGAMDVNLEGGQTRVDHELLAPPPAGPPAGAGLDLDLGRAIGGGAAPTTAATEEAGLDLHIATLTPGSSGEFPAEDVQRSSDSTVELPTLEVPSGADDAAFGAQPDLDRSDHTIREPFRMPAVAAINSDATAELSVDDLGIDLGDLEALGGTAGVPEISLDDTSSTLHGFDATGQIDLRDEATRLAPQVAAAEPDATRRPPPGDDDGRTEMLPAIKEGDSFDLDLTQISGPADVAETGSTALLGQTTNEPSLDFDTGETMRAAESTPISLFDAMVPDSSSTERIDVSKMGQLPDLEPLTLSEVGTKLDLARAYMDMGDPDGARSILEEVLAEGSASQKQDARRLLDTLPGSA